MTSFIKIFLISKKKLQSKIYKLPRVPTFCLLLVAANYYYENVQIVQHNRRTQDNLVIIIIFRWVHWAQLFSFYLKCYLISRRISNPVKHAWIPRFHHRCLNGPNCASGYNCSQKILSLFKKCYNNNKALVSLLF